MNHVNMRRDVLSASLGCIACQYSVYRNLLFAINHVPLTRVYMNKVNNRTQIHTQVVPRLMEFPPFETIQK